VLDDGCRKFKRERERCLGVKKRNERREERGEGVVL
jgi:hypothetical protein